MENKLLNSYLEKFEVGCKYSQDSYFELYSMNVDEEYQKAGNGSEIIRLGEEYFDNVTYPEFGTDNYPTEQGANLLNSARFDPPCLHHT